MRKLLVMAALATLVSGFCGLSPGQERQTLPLEEKAKTASWIAPDGSVHLAAGTRIPLRLLNTISSRNAAAGNQVYLQTIIPLFVERQLVIPAGSHVMGTVSKVQRPGKVKGRGELYLMFDYLLLPNGAKVDLRSRLSGVDGSVPGQLSPGEGKVSSEGGRTGDAMAVGGSSLAGAAMGGWIGGRGAEAGIGAAAGAAAGLAAVLLTRGPEAVVPQGSTLEMVLDRDLRLLAEDLAGISGRPAARR